jgi:signal transduction histidine kinase
MERERIVALLETHAALRQAPPTELEWLATRGEWVTYPQGTKVNRKGEAIDYLYVVLSGRMAHHLDRGAGPRRVMEWRGGDLSGLLPFSRLTHSPGDTVVEEAGEMLAVHRSHFPELIRECPTIAAICVHTMLDRARVFTSSDLQDEKMVSLGRLAAGLAHELNNPASAAVRSAKLLAELLPEADRMARELGAAGLDHTQTEVLERVRDVCLASAGSGVLSPLERSDREEALAAWLEGHGVSQETAPALAETAVTLEALDELARALSGPRLDAALRWIGAGCTTRSLVLSVERTAGRIQQLVSAMKRFTHMDRALASAPLNVAAGLTDAVTMLLHKARQKNVAVALELPPSLPPVVAVEGELNQIWLNLLDNALDAAPEDGHVAISAMVELTWLAVSFQDDGPGIPAEIRHRIFDPFFTTKPVGQGTGLGLDIVRRLVAQHRGELDLDSRPGATRFTVRLPLAELEGTHPLRAPIRDLR